MFSMAMIEIRGVHYAYDGKTEVLKGIDAALERGKMYAILGPSGCGKTTLLSLLGGLDSPTAGKILVEGRPLGEAALAQHRKSRVAFIFQSYNLIDYLTPRENVALASTLPPEPLLARMGLTPAEIRRNVLRLSGGQQQRVVIARALASDAPILLADEPTGNLDEDTAAEITGILKDSAHRMNKCVVIVTHSGRLAREADEVLRLRRGVLLGAEQGL